MSSWILPGTLSTKEGVEEIVILHGQKEREERRDEERVTQWGMCLNSPGPSPRS